MRLRFSIALAMVLLAIGLFIVVILSSCEGKIHSNPIPKRGDKVSRDYDRFELVEDTDKYVKYRAGADFTPNYYITCDHDDIILSVWSGHF